MTATLDNRTPIETLAEALRIIGDGWGLLRSQMASVSAGTGAPPHTPESPIPGGVTRVSLSVQIQREVAFLCGVALDLDSSGTVRFPADVGQRAKLLLPHAEAITEVVGEADLDPVREAAHHLRAAVAPSGSRRIPIGFCPVVSCPGGSLWAHVSTDASRIMPEVVCDLDDSHRWDEMAYRRLAAMLSGQDIEARMTVKEWLAWAAARGSAPTEKAVYGWTRHKPITVGWDGETLDTIRTMDYWLEVRARRAS